MTNSELAALFVELADTMEIASENHFKIRSYRKAAVNISELNRSVEGMTSGEIRDIPGIGKAIFEKISEALLTGTFPTLEKWRASGYTSFLPLLEMPGVTTRKLGVAISKLKTESMVDMKDLVDRGQADILSDIDGNVRRAILKHILRG
jgi:DNA polymerase (family 10)